MLKVLNYQTFHIIRQYLYWPKLVHVTICYYSCTEAAQLMRGAFHLDTSLICWFTVIRVICCVCSNLYAWRSWQSTRQEGQEIPQQLLYRFFCKPFQACPWHLPVTLIKLFFFIKANLLVLVLKAIPLQALPDPKDSRRFRFPDFKKISTWRWQGCQP
jgi:hypothetical protein